MTLTFLLEAPIPVGLILAFHIWEKTSELRLLRRLLPIAAKKLAFFSCENPKCGNNFPADWIRMLDVKVSSISGKLYLNIKPKIGRI